MTEFRVLFWNTYRKPLTDRVARLAKANRADLVLLAESTEKKTESVEMEMDLPSSTCGAE